MSLSKDEIVIKPIAVKEYQVKQSKYSQCGKLPIRSILLGPSGSGKTVLLQNMILNLYRGCFERVYIFSPSINVDASWEPVKTYIEEEMDAHETDSEKFYFDSYDAEALENIILTQNKLIQHMKSKNKKRLFQILIIIDDMADNPVFTRSSKLLHSLYTRGRHAFISTVTATQQYHALAPIIRINATELFVYRLRNQKDLEAVLEGTSALIDKQTLLKIYHECVAEPHSFLYIKLSSPDINNMFYCNFSKQIKFED